LFTNPFPTLPKFVTVTKVSSLKMPRNTYLECNKLMVKNIS